MFAEALAAGTMNNFFKLIEQFRTQVSVFPCNPCPLRAEQRAVVTGPPTAGHRRFAGAWRAAAAPRAPPLRGPAGHSRLLHTAQACPVRALLAALAVHRVQTAARPAVRVVQDEPAYCGLSSLAMTLNTLSIDPRRTWKGPWRWWEPPPSPPAGLTPAGMPGAALASWAEQARKRPTAALPTACRWVLPSATRPTCISPTRTRRFHEEMLDCCHPLPKVREEGITLTQARRSGCGFVVPSLLPLPQRPHMRQRCSEACSQGMTQTRCDRQGSGGSNRTLPALQLGAASWEGAQPWLSPSASYRFGGRRAPGSHCFPLTHGPAPATAHIAARRCAAPQAACLARCNGARVELYPYGSVTVAEFRAMVADACSTAEQHIVVSYSRKEFLQTGVARRCALCGHRG